MSLAWRIASAGDRALLVTLAETMTPRTLGMVLALDRALCDRAGEGVESTVPAYSSVLCRFDPDRIDAARVTELIRGLEGSLAPRRLDGRTVDCPVVYEGPDLDRVAEHAGLSREDVIGLHAGQEYLVYCLGFAPGFAYCGELPASLHVPRLPSPRPRVASGSVAIAGRQTGIYAVESPGGWNLIGRTDLRLFDPDREPPALLRVGDRIRFRPRR